MAFDIEKMKADGVSSHLIELASISQETLLLLTARRLENDKFFQQFMGENAGSIEAMYPYAVAAGLMSEDDRLWLIDEDNPYKDQKHVLFTFSGRGGMIEYHNGAFSVDGTAQLVETSVDVWNDIFTNHDKYIVKMDAFGQTIELPYETDAYEGEITGTGDQRAQSYIYYSENGVEGGGQGTGTDSDIAIIYISEI